MENQLLTEVAPKLTENNLLRLIEVISGVVGDQESPLLESIVEQIFNHLPENDTEEYNLMYEYLTRTSLRVKADKNKVVERLNTVHKVDATYHIENYDYEKFKWARENCPDFISNLCISLPEEKLKSNVIQQLENLI